MRFITYQSSSGSPAKVGLQLGNHVLEIDVVFPGEFPDLLKLITNISDSQMAHLRATAETTNQDSLPDLKNFNLLAPIPIPRGDILCVGVNYASHKEESKKHFSSSAKAISTVYFSKRAGKISGPESVINCHAGIDPSLDYEAELAVIIGRQGVDIPHHQADEYIFGYSVFNDFTARSLQALHGQWFRGKSLDGFAAMGPAIVHKSSIANPMDLTIRCSVGNELRQSASTSLLIKDIPSIIAEISSGMTLYPGDIIATGTPAGVGMSFAPPKYLHLGDTVVCEIQDIGVLRNYIA